MMKYFCDNCKEEHSQTDLTSTRLSLIKPVSKSYIKANAHSNRFRLLCDTCLGRVVLAFEPLGDGK